MSFISKDFQKGKISGALFGAGIAYGFVGSDLLSLGLGAAGGFFLYPMAQKAVVGASLPVISADQRIYVLPAVLGGAVGYGVYFGDPMYAAAGAAAGAALEYVQSSY